MFRGGVRSVVGRCGNRRAGELCAVCLALEDWSPGGTMTLLEQYNGLGYASRVYPSPLRVVRHGSIRERQVCCRQRVQRHSR